MRRNDDESDHARIIAKVIEYLAAAKQKGVPIWLLKVHGGLMQRSGVPDILCCINGRFVGLEIKAGDDMAKPHQAKELADIKAAKGKSYIIRDDVNYQMNQVLRDCYSDWNITNEQTSA